MTPGERAPVFTGVGVALVTLFDDDRRVDVAATVAHAERLVADGIRAVVIAGSTGEAPALTGQERADLVAATRDRLAADIPVIAGTGAVTADQAVEMSRLAVDAGADALLVLSPMRSHDPRPYYDAVAGAIGDVPMLAYHFPGMSAPGIPVAMLSELPVVGVKDSSADATRLLEEVAGFDGDIYTGSSALLVQAAAIGCAGAILALANLEPAGCVAAFDGDGDAQRELTAAHLAVSADFPFGVKRAVAAKYATSAVTRMG